GDESASPDDFAAGGGDSGSGEYAGDYHEFGAFETVDRGDAGVSGGADPCGLQRGGPGAVFAGGRIFGGGGGSAVVVCGAGFQAEGVGAADSGGGGGTGKGEMPVASDRAGPGGAVRAVGGGVGDWGRGGIRRADAESGGGVSCGGSLC